LVQLAKIFAKYAILILLFKDFLFDLRFVKINDHY